MLENELRASELLAIPDKRYFTIGEVGEICRVKSHVLRYWEQEFKQLNPVRPGNRRYYRREDVVLVRNIRNLLYEQRFTIDGAKVQLLSGKTVPKVELRQSSMSLIKQRGRDVMYYRQLLRQTIGDLEKLLE